MKNGESITDFWWEDSELSNKLIGEWAWGKLPHFDWRWGESQGLGKQTASNAFETWDNGVREQLWAIREKLDAMEPEPFEFKPCPCCGGVAGAVPRRVVIDYRGEVRDEEATRWEESSRTWREAHGYA